MFKFSALQEWCGRCILQNGQGAMKIMCLSNSGTSGHAGLAPLVVHIMLDNIYIYIMLCIHAAKLALIILSPARYYPAVAVKPLWQFVKRGKRAVHYTGCVVRGGYAAEGLAYNKYVVVFVVSVIELLPIPTKALQASLPLASPCSRMYAPRD